MTLPPSEDTARPAHHRPHGGFRNPWPNAIEHGALDVLRWLIIDRARHRRPPNPDPSVFPLARPAFAVPRNSAGALGVTWVGHSTFLVQIGGLNVLTDPMWSDRASPLSWAGPRRLVQPGIAMAALPPISVVLLSHNHYDHLDAPTVRALARSHPDAVWVTPLGLADAVSRHGVRVAVPGSGR